MEDAKLVPAEPYAEEVKFHVEKRLLQRDVEITLDAINNANVVGNIIHPVRIKFYLFTRIELTYADLNLIITSDNVVRFRF